MLFELGGMSQAEIASSIGVPSGKVKALVFQARTELMAERDARSTPCATIREELAVARGGALRRGPLRRHLNHCEPCQAYRTAVASQRAGFALILPVAPALGLKAGVLAAIAGKGALEALLGGGVAGGAAGGGAGASGGSAAHGAGASGGSAATRRRRRRSGQGRRGAAARRPAARAAAARSAPVGAGAAQPAAALRPGLPARARAVAPQRPVRRSWRS